jgi:hypothetical protein
VETGKSTFNMDFVYNSSHPPVLRVFCFLNRFKSPEEDDLYFMLYEMDWDGPDHFPCHDTNVRLELNIIAFTLSWKRKYSICRWCMFVSLLFPISLGCLSSSGVPQQKSMDDNASFVFSAFATLTQKLSMITVLKVQLAKQDF